MVKQKKQICEQKKFLEPLTAQPCHIKVSELKVVESS